MIGTLWRIGTWFLAAIALVGIEWLCDWLESKIDPLEIYLEAYPGLDPNETADLDVAFLYMELADTSWTESPWFDEWLQLARREASLN